MASLSRIAVPPSAAKNLFTDLVRRVSMLTGWAASAMLVCAVAITCQMIFIRFVLNGSTVWQTEAVIYLVIAATLIGLPFVQQQRGHVNVDLIPIWLSPEARYRLAVFTLSSVSVITTIMLWYGFDFWHQAYSRGWRSDTVWAVQLWIPYLSLPLGFGLLLLQLLADLYAVVMKFDPPFGLEDK